jgi:enamine deaminase RidA (YjgF/YER057c/UK114 family)
MHADREVLHRSFRGAGGCSEHFISVTPDGDLDLAGQIVQIGGLYDGVQRDVGLRPESAICRRLFVSDVINQAGMVRASPLAAETSGNPVAVSLVQQMPMAGAKLALLAYHAEGGGNGTKRRLSAHDMLVERNGTRHLWTTGLCAGDARGESSAATQTHTLFDALVASLARQGGTLRDHCLRTWIYLKNVDVFYGGMVAARGRVFAEQGLTADTHFIASTGIEGACAHHFDLVAMDAVSNLDLKPGQISYLNDYDRLCPTAEYNVHFERGTKVAYADRAHLLISGTASIDKAGHVVHEGDVLRQYDRALNNIEALLRSGDAVLADLAHLIVYLRDPADYARIRLRLAESVPEVPTVIVQGAVCRPQWLIEIEGVAIAANHQPSMPAY